MTFSGYYAIVTPKEVAGIQTQAVRSTSATPVAVVFVVFAVFYFTT